jgi:hypothetical protein
MPSLLWVREYVKATNLVSQRAHSERGKLRPAHTVIAQESLETTPPPFGAIGSRNGKHHLKVRGQVRCVQW